MTGGYKVIAATADYRVVLVSQSGAQFHLFDDRAFPTRDFTFLDRDAMLRVFAAEGAALQAGARPTAPFASLSDVRGWRNHAAFMHAFSQRTP